jgi:putative ABC transport system permease protein
MDPSRLIRRIAYWWRFRAQQNELREELELHRELLAEDLERGGIGAGAARAAANRAMGNQTLMREEARAVWLSAGLESVIKDWRYAWRGLLRSRVFAVAVVVIMALTIAANAAIFSVVEHLLISPLPFPQGNRIVRLQLESAADPLAGQFDVDAQVIRQLRARSRTLDEFSAVATQRARIGNDPDGPTVATAAITPSFLPMLRVRPFAGRGFTDADAQPGATAVLLGFDFWQSQYSGARDVVGRTLSVNGAPHTIVGVLPRGFDIPMSLDETPKVWLPLDLDSVGSGVAGYARLIRGATSAAATREMQSIVREVADARRLKGLHATAATAQDQVDPRDKRAIELLFATVCGLLLIACANIATLLLMRGWTRHRELVIRLALGASRLRVARQLLSESFLLAILGGALGLALAWRGLRAFVTVLPSGPATGSITRFDGVGIDPGVLGWTVVLILGTGLLYGIGPAFFSGTRSLGDALRAGAPASAENKAARRFRNALVVAQIAMSLTFLSAAALLVRSFVALARTPLGLDPVGLVTLQVKLARRPEQAARRGMEQTLIDALHAVPGVSGAAFGGGLAMTHVRMGPFAVDGPSGLQPLDLVFCETPIITADYFRVARIPIVEGRAFDESDPARASQEVVVNKAFARRFLPSGLAVGSRIRVGDGSNAEWLTVVGVAGDVHLPGTNGDLFNLQMYRSTSAAGEFPSYVMLRVTPGVGALEPVLKRAVEGAGLSAKLVQVWTTEEVVDRRVLARPRFAVAVFGVFALLALVVAAAGLYGIIAYAVTQRTREIGVRVALGADSLAVARLVLGDSARLVMVGGCVGLFGVYATTRLVSGFLFAIRPTDPTALIGAATLLAIVALIATLVPIRRALGIDPMEALRAD